jgi:hypothetical protein
MCIKTRLKAELRPIVDFVIYGFMAFSTVLATNSNSLSVTEGCTGSESTLFDAHSVISSSPV